MQEAQKPDCSQNTEQRTHGKDKEPTKDTTHNWGPQIEWIYGGHGEWVEPEVMMETAQHGNKLASG